MHYWLTLAGLALMIIDLTMAGVVQGFSWAGLSHWGESVVASMPFWWTRTIAGLMIVAGQALFFWALVATARQPAVAPDLAPVGGVAAEA
jgi:cbb3-type cytochrome oxidase subunit 1